MQKKQLFMALVMAMSGIASNAADVKVSTDTRFARGATMAFARITVSGTVSEKGVCWGTTPTPSAAVNKVTATISTSGDFAGGVYWLKNLTPSTKYYMRAYAISGTDTVYGNAVKFYTIPKGTMSYYLREGDSDDGARARIDAAMATAVNWWNNLTSIQGLQFNVGYNSGTPTADCSYGGYIRVGPTQSYQAVGTMLHEMLHGVGVGTYNNVWRNGNIRSNGDRGYWLGDRTTEVVRFLTNNAGARLNGDNTHMWPFGINGAHEDTHADQLYIGNSLICQALGEDGLPYSDGSGFATPSYVFDQEDTTKYYIKSESEDYGLYTSYLVQNANGSLSYKEMSAKELLGNDSAAWYVTFDPVRCFYAFRNAATGNYISFTTSNAKFITRNVATLTSSEYLQLMRARVNAITGTKLRGYYLIYRTASLTPRCITGATNGNVATGYYDFSDLAKAQRWLIMDKNDLKEFYKITLTPTLTRLDTLLSQVKTLKTTAHTENVAGADAAFDNALANIKTAEVSCGSATEAEELIEDVKNAAKEFLKNTTPSSLNQPYDLTYMINNSGMDTTVYWGETLYIGSSCTGYSGQAFDFNQTLTDLPVGKYILRAQGFQRPGMIAKDSYTKYANGLENITANLYANADSVKLKSVWSDTMNVKINNVLQAGNPTMGFIPKSLEGARYYFDFGRYENVLVTKLKADGSMKIGIRNTNADENYWTVFDNVRLYYFGQNVSDETLGVKTINTNAPFSTNRFNVYGIDGRLVRRNASNLSGLTPGLYIVNGKKFVVNK
jgi:hypothetical protein